jgi:putative serine protease PepD
LIKNGKATYPVIGVSVDMSVSGKGALIASKSTSIMAGGPAAKAGLKPGDLITDFDGRVITSPEELIVAVRSRDIGDSVLVKYIRDGKSYQATLILTAGK